MASKVAVWIVADPRPEHIRAVSWLNESRATNFYLIKVEAVQIDASRPAPLLTLIVGPSVEGKEVGETKRELAERHTIRQRFWTQLLDLVKTKTTLHANLSPSHDNWIATSAGRAGIYSHVIRQHNTNIELYIDRGNEAENLAIFEALEMSKSKIEEAFGSPLEWQRLPDKRACRISYTIHIGGYKDEDKWPEIHAAMVDAMIRFDRAFKPFIARL
jgi:hypothetical protein